MSDKISIKELLEGVEVEWKPLNEVCEFKNGFAFKSNLFKRACKFNKETCGTIKRQKLP